MKEKLPYYVKRKDGGWTFQCPHEPEYIKLFFINIEGGEIVLCKECAREIALDFVKYIDKEEKQ